MAYNQVAVYGMSKTIGLVSYPPDDSKLNKPYSSETAQMIDREVKSIVDTAYDRTISLLTEKKALVEKLALTLLDKEVLLLPFRDPELLELMCIAVLGATAACNAEHLFKKPVSQIIALCTSSCMNPEVHPLACKGGMQVGFCFAEVTTWFSELTLTRLLYTGCQLRCSRRNSRAQTVQEHRVAKH